jgi:hypothetical protein
VLSAAKPLLYTWRKTIALRERFSRRADQIIRQIETDWYMGCVMAERFRFEAIGHDVVRQTMAVRCRASRMRECTVSTD